MRTVGSGAALAYVKKTRIPQHVAYIYNIQLLLERVRIEFAGLSRGRTDAAGHAVVGVGPGGPGVGGGEKADRGDSGRGRLDGVRGSRAGGPAGSRAGGARLWSADDQYLRCASDEPTSGRRLWGGRGRFVRAPCPCCPRRLCPSSSLHARNTALAKTAAVAGLALLQGGGRRPSRPIAGRLTLRNPPPPRAAAPRARPGQPPIHWRC